MAQETTIPEGVRLAAIKDALDHGGITAKTAVDVEVSAKPWESLSLVSPHLLADLVLSSAQRGTQGLAESAQVVDAEIVEPEPPTERLVDPDDDDEMNWWFAPG